MRTPLLLLSLVVLLALAAGALLGDRSGFLRAQQGPPAPAAAVTPPVPQEDEAAPEQAAAAAEDAPRRTASLPDPEPSAPACTPAALEERAAAVLVLGLPGVTDPQEPLAHELPELGVGGVLITKTNVVSEEQITGLLDALRARSAGPLLVATDEEPGRVSSFGDLLGRSSSARTVARRDSPEQVRAAAEEQGRALRELGVDLVLAPVADLDDGPAQGVIGDRSFSPDPETATEYVRAHAAGLVDGGVLPTVKHFPGHGRTQVDSHFEPDVVETAVEELLDSDLVPFVDQIEQGTPVVMLSHVTYPALGDELPASLSPGAYALLRELGFDGVAMTDSLGMGAIHTRWDFPESAVLAVVAGADALLATHGDQAERMRDALVLAVEDGDLAEERLDEAVTRMRLLAGGDPADLVCTAARSETSS